MTPTLRPEIVTGAVGVLASIAYFMRRRKSSSERAWSSECICGDKDADSCGATTCRSSHSTSTVSTSSSPFAALASLVTGCVPSASVSNAIPERWQGRGVIRAIGVKAPEESILDVMADFYERVLRDDESKDVEIEMSNGSLHAHSVILSASSDAIKGILRHAGAGGSGKMLSWREYPIEVGSVLLRLLYTGTVDEGDFLEDSAREGADSADPTAEQKKVPLSILLGSFEIAMIYLITHLLPSLVQALQHRLAVDTFNAICTTAIKVDAMALRLYCLQYARGNPRKLSYEELKSGMRVRAIRQIDHEHADVAEGTMGTVEWGHGDWLDIHWSCHPSYTNGLQEVLGSIEIVGQTMPGMTLRQMYDAEEFSPEVMSELATIWGQVRPTVMRKRRTHRIM